MPAVAPPATVRAVADGLSGGGLATGLLADDGASTSEPVGWLSSAPSRSAFSPERVTGHRLGSMYRPTDKHGRKGVRVDAGDMEREFIRGARLRADAGAICLSALEVCDASAELLRSSSALAGFGRIHLER